MSDKTVVIPEMPETELHSKVVLTMKGVPKWSPEGRRQVAAWLRQQANFLLNEGDKIGNRYRARFLTYDE